MSSDSTMTVRLSLPLILAQAAKVGRYVEDARGYVCRLLESPASVKCCCCCQQEGVEYSIPINKLCADDDDDDEFDPTKWSVQYDPTAAPTSEEANSLDSSAGHVTFRGIKLVSPTFHIGETRNTSSKKASSGCAHQIDMNTEIKIVLRRLQLAQHAISNSTGSELSSSFLYAPPDCRTTVSVDSTDPFPEHTYDRVEQLLHCCERQYDFFTGCPELPNITDIFSIKSVSTSSESSSSSEEEAASEDDDWPAHHPFDSAIDFTQMPSSLDPAPITSWIDITTSTVARCQHAQQSHFTWQLSPAGDFRSPEFSSTALLRKLGCAQSTISHFRSRFRTRPVQTDEAVASAMHAIFNENPLGTLALCVARAAVRDAEPENLRDGIKMKLLGGGYGMWSRDYTRKALVTIEAEGMTEEGEERGGPVEGVFCSRS
ncbi:hypothetical protein CERZMDRAFT_89201 [Cercospora zeae-maydis SCOH1-5]|uniref:Uncharacterized protein n=1 Tax=Cercospora zeae-maydis SCOH1-5 TaxID=717836 RepID=A0A6A6EZR6_9PEZI|nr:hypothetical protein CERZMDRAFT_89201 [Cercospora zeae-maydis SCOH1-5]